MTTPTLANLDAIHQMVQNIAAKNLVAVTPAFDAEMTNKIQDRLVARKQEIASTLYSQPKGDEVVNDPVVVPGDEADAE